MWIYQQSSGKLFSNTTAGICTFEGEGYSGHVPGVNNPEMQQIHDVGPCPRGMFYMKVIRGEDGQPCDHNGKKAPVILLIPEPGTETFGRTNLEMHGDDIRHPGEKLGSLGCIVAPKPVREKVAASGDYLLKVIE